MKKGTRTWKLYGMLLLHLMAIIGVTGVYAEYAVNQEVNGFIQMLATLALIALLAVFISRSVDLLTRILKRKQLW